jgi:anti-sigma factor RsiW
MNCLHRLDAALLADYWLAALAKDEEEAVEEHLFACDECGSRLREMMALAEGIRQLAREGSLQMVVSETFLQRVAQDGLRVRQYDLAPGGSVQCTVTADDDLLIGRLAADLSGAEQVDLCFCDQRGVEQARLSDIPFQSGAGAVAWQPSITWAKAGPSNTLIARLVTFDETGAERLLGEYTFHHTRTLPGPGAW